jgi:hypothetical protein
VTYTSQAPRADVWGREDLTCPLSRAAVARWLRFAMTNPWQGDQPIADRRHTVDTTAILEPGRITRVMLSLDVGAHASGWFANSDYERCLHLSLSHPRIGRRRVYPANEVAGTHLGYDLDAPSDDEARAWGRVVFRRNAPMAWFEPAAGVADAYRSPGVVHLRLYLDGQDRPMVPYGEVYTLRPFTDGTSPARILEGRAGADVK